MFGIYVMAVGSSLQKAYTMLLGMFLGLDFMNLCFICLKSWVVEGWNIHSWRLGYIIYKVRVIIYPEQKQEQTS